jgi:hypothetical protein
VKDSVFLDEETALGIAVYQGVQDHAQAYATAGRENTRNSIFAYHSYSGTLLEGMCSLGTSAC